MSRWETAANSAETGKPLFQRRNFVTITVSGGGFVRAWDGVGHFFDGTNSWAGLGAMGTVTPVQEESDMFPRAVRLRVSALPTSFNPLFTELTSERIFNQEVTLSRGFMALGSLALVSSLSERFYGRVGNIEGQLADQSHEAFFELTVDNPLRAPPRNGTYSHEDHQTSAAGSGDTGFKFLPNGTELPALWGKHQVGPSGSPGGSPRTLPGFPGFTPHPPPGWPGFGG